MPKHHQLKRGAPRKFRFGQLARREDGVLMVIVGYGGVDHPHARDSQHKYRVVEYRTAWRMRVGRASWLWPWQLEAIDSKGIPAFGDDTQARAVYKANRRLGARKGRGCDCQCCAHIALPPGMTATSKWDPFEQYLVDAETVRSGKALVRESLRISRLRQADEAAEGFDGDV